MLKINNLNTRYGTVKILRDVSLRIKSKEIIAYLGANGAGKTTTLRAIMGLIKDTTGSIHFKEKEITNAKTNEIVKLGISMVMESNRVFPGITVFKNLLLGAIYDNNKDEIEKRLEKVYNLFPVLKKRTNQLSGTLSGGEQGMLAIGRGLMSGPQLLLLDEPSLGLAPKLVDEVFETIKRINIEEGLTILLVEQNAFKAFKVSDRGYVLQKGQIITEGTIDELRENSIIKKAYLAV